MKIIRPWIALSLLGVLSVSCDKRTAAIDELREKGIIRNELALNEPDNDGCSPLLKAVMQGNDRLVELLLDAEADVNAKGPGGVTPIMLAVGNRRKDYVESMLERRVKVQGAQPLTLAIMNDMPELVRPLLAAGAGADPFDSKVLTPLSAAVLKKDKESFPAVLAATVEESKSLLDLSSRLPYHDKPDNRLTPLTLALDLGLDDFADELLKAGADPKCSGVDHASPLELAAAHGNIKYVKRLLPLCKDDKAICSEALVAAAKNGKMTCLKLLLETDCLDYTEKYSGQQPLMRIVQDAPVRAIELVLQKGVDVNALDKSHRTALGLALRCGRVDVAELLLQAGADINAENQKGETLLGSLVGSKNTVGVKFLLDHGANANGKDKRGNPLLLEALLRDSMEMAGLLIERGADVNAKDAGGFPIINFVSSKKEALVLLLRSGADLRERDADGQPVLKRLWRDADFRKLLEEIVK